MNASEFSTEAWPIVEQAVETSFILIATGFFLNIGWKTAERVWPRRRVLYLRRDGENGSETDNRGKGRGER